MTTDSRCDSALVRRRIAAHFYRASERRVVSRQREARRDDIDRACRCGRAEEQCGRSAHDLDTISEQRFERNGVIVRQRGDIEGVGPVLVGLNA